MKKDIVTKNYFSQNKIFSKIFNYYLFDGKDVIKENDLIELDTNQVISNPNLIKRERDILKEAIIKSDNNYDYLLLGIENQSKINNGMILRNLLYDSISYSNQALDIVNTKNNAKIKLDRYSGLSKNDKLKPVITLVIYFSYKKWTGAKDLHSMLYINDKELLKYIPNYKLNIIEPYNMTEEDFIKLGSLSTLFRFIKASGNKDELNDLITKNESFKKTDVKMMELLNNILDLNIEIKNTEDINMCKAIEDMKKDAKKEGKQEAINENIKTMYSNGADINMIAKLLNLDINFVKKVLA